MAAVEQAVRDGFQLKLVNCVLSEPGVEHTNGYESPVRGVSAAVHLGRRTLRQKRIDHEMLNALAFLQYAPVLMAACRLGPTGR
jgi:hypothetical protein